MDHKKKSLGGLKLLLLLLFGLSFVGLSTECKAYTTYNGRPQLNSGEFLEIIEEINQNNNWSGDVVETARNTWNNWSRTYSDDFILENVVFFKSGTSNYEIGWFLSNGTFSNILDFYALLPYNGQLSANNVPITSSTNALQIEGFTSWIEDSNENRTGMNLFRPTGFFLSPNSANTVTTRANQTIIVSGRDATGNLIAITIDGRTVFTPQLVTFNRYYTVASHTNSSGYEWFFLTHHLQFTNESAPTPTPIPSGEPPVDPTSIPSSSIDLTQTNAKIDQVNSSVQEVNSSVQELINQQSGDTNKIVNSLTTEYDPENINVTSGDIISSLGFDLMTDRYSNFFLTLTQNLSDSLSSSVRTFTFTSFDGSTIVIDLDDIPIQMPPTIRWLISFITSFGIVLVILRYNHDIYVKVTSGNVDEVLAMNEDNGIIDLF